jgi:hypothetical protein
MYNIEKLTKTNLLYMGRTNGSNPRDLWNVIKAIEVEEELTITSEVSDGVLNGYRDYTKTFRDVLVAVIKCERLFAFDIRYLDEGNEHDL